MDRPQNGRFRLDERCRYRNLKNQNGFLLILPFDYPSDFLNSLSGYVNQVNGERILALTLPIPLRAGHGIPVNVRIEYSQDAVPILILC